MTISNNFRITPATPADIPLLSAMIHELAEYEKLTHLVVTDHERLREALFGDVSSVEAILGWEGDEAIAFALYFHNFSTFLGRRGLYLEDLFVRPSYRRKGYGRALLIYLAQLAVQRGCGRFEWSVLDWNQPAIQFYENLGATVLPDWRIVRLTGQALEELASKKS